jgi:DNA-binding NarL/FixJ family response regulator
MFGRDDELTAIVGRLRARRGRSVVIAGPPGSGKTRLAAEVVREVAKTNVVIHRVVATLGLHSVPFGAFATAMPELDLSGGLVAVLQRVPGSLRDDRHLLLVDDAQLLDNASAELLSHLVRSGSCLAVITVRTPAPLPEAVADLWKGDDADHLKLTGLAPCAVEEIAAALLGGPLAASTVRWLVQASEGNPLYVRELVASASASKALVEDAGRWLVRQPVPASGRLVDLVAGRLDGLSAAAIEVVDLLAVGQPLPFELLVTLAGDRAVEDAEFAGVLEPRGGSAVGLSHPLLAEVRRQQLPRTRLRRISARLAETMKVDEFSSRPDVLRVARWALDAGSAPDLDLLVTAATTARAMAELDLAESFARHALSAGAGAPAALVLGEALFFSGRLDEADDVLCDAAPLCRNDSDLAAITAARAYLLGTLKGDRAAAVQLLAEVAPKLEDVSAQMKVMGSLTMLRVLAGEPRLAAESALTVAGASDTAIANRGLYYAAVAHAQMGAGEAALVFAARGLGEHATPAKQAASRREHNVGFAMAQLGMGRFRDAGELSGAMRDLAGRDHEMEATYCLLGGMAAFEQGQLSMAHDLFSDGIAHNRAIEDLAPLRWCLGGLALTTATIGDLDRASRAISELDGLGSHWMELFEAELVNRGRAWMRVLRGDVSGAIELLVEAAADAAGRGQHVGEGSLLHDVVRLGAPHLAGDRLLELEDHVDGDLIDAYSAHARGAIAGDVDLLEEAANRFERTGALLYAAEAGATAARLHEQAGSGRRAALWRQHVDQLVNQCGPVRTPALLGRSQAATLTRREREVACLATSGATATMIAAQLHLSVRTVENHLQRAYTKLGVTRREELSSMLAEN